MKGRRSILSKYTKILVFCVIGISLFMTTSLALSSDDISINNLNNGEIRAGIFEIKGTVIDDKSVDKIAVQVGEGPWEVAEGTTTWKYTVNARQIVTGYKYIFDPELGTLIQKYDRGYRFGDIPIKIGIFDASSNCLATKTVTPRIVPEPPIANVSTGAFDGLIKVQLKTAPGVSIFYTTNGNNPTESSARYNGTLSLSIPVVLKAIAKSENGYLSDILDLDYDSPLQNIPKIAAGYDHTLAIKNDGKVWAWGSNAYGQLGNGSTISSYVHVPVNHLENVITIAAGNSHSLAVKNDGTIWAWGDNSNGQLGNGITMNSCSIPKQVPELKNVVAVAAGYQYSLALTEDGKVWAWGINQFGQLGDGTLDLKRSTPKQVANLDTVIAISAGAEHCLALRKDGTVWAWGNNLFGALGNSSTGLTSRIPVQVMKLTNVIAIAGGRYHSLALKKDGTVWAWGDNGYGQAGQGSKISILYKIPVLVPNLNNVIAITSGYNHNLALTNDGKIWAWGYNNQGQLGDGTNQEKESPKELSNLTNNIVAIAAGGGHSIALLNNGTVRSWGNNNNGQLGNKSKTDSNSPVVAGVPGQMPVIAPYQYTLTITNDGKGTSTPTGSMVVKNGESINITANPKNGCLFNNWTKESGTGTVVFGDFKAASTTVTITGGNATIQSNFLPDPNVQFKLTVENDGNGTTNPAGQQQIANWSTINLNAFANPGYRFINWTKTAGMGEVEFDNEYAANANVTVNGGDVTIKANFYEELTANKWVTGSITARGSKWYVFTGTPGEYVINWDDIDNGLGTGTYTCNVNVTYNRNGNDFYILVIDTTNIGGTFAINIAPKRSLTIDSMCVYPSGLTPVGDGVGFPITIKYQNEYLLGWEISGTGKVVFSNQRNLVGQYGNLITNCLVTVTGSDATIKPVLSNAPLPDIAGIFAGYDHCLLVMNNGSVWTWGDNSSGELGNGTNIRSIMPGPVNNLTDIIEIAGGYGQSLALKKDGAIWAWGYLLGDGTNNGSNTPLQVNNINLIGAIAIACGDRHNLVLKNDGTVWGWGYNDGGQLGTGNYNSPIYSPVQVNISPKVTAITCGTSHNLALTSEGKVWAWGWNNRGELGKEFSIPNNRSFTPEQIVGLDNVIAIAGGYMHSLALTRDGKVLAWGNNDSGQLGYMTDPNSYSFTPQRVSSLNNIIAIAAGRRHSLALQSDGTVWAWGRNWECQLGNGTVSGPQYNPVKVANLTNVIAITSKENYCLALKSDGTVWAWGENGSYGQYSLGSLTTIAANGALTGSNIPVPVGGNNMQEISSYQFALTVTNDGNGSSTPVGSMVVKNGVPTDYITAIPKPGYKFKEWTKIAGDGIVSFGNYTAASTTVIITGGNVTIQANFLEDTSN